MTAGDRWADRFTLLWTTHIFERHLAAHESRNPALVETIQKMDAETDDMTVAYKGMDFLKRPEPAIEWLLGEVNETLRGYLKVCGITYPIRFDIQAWPNVNRHGDYHGPHNHGWSYLSGTYYVQVPAERPQDGEDSLHPAAITFSDPRHGAYRHSLAADPNAQARYTVHPRPGTLLMWPSTLTHYVHPNLSDETRISISFNVVLEWSNDYAA